MSDSIFKPYAENHTKWTWIELIGFDNTQPDFGIKHYIDTLGFIPEGISLLLHAVEFVMVHESTEECRQLIACTGSYGAHPYNNERARQEWTNLQLRDFIKKLQEYGIKVFFGFFNFFTYKGSKEYDGFKFCENHPEIFDVSRDGHASSGVNVLKHLSDGSLFDDLFIRKTLETLDYYGFDGFHAADGISSGRNTLQYYDFSDDMLSQFAEYSGITGKSAKWILENALKEWIEFHRIRYGSYITKLVKSLHDKGYKVLVNSAWTRDPMESIYRYGTDYKLWAEAGADAIMVEQVSITMAIEDLGPGYETAPIDRDRSYYQYAAMLLAIHAYVPEMKLLPLTQLKDTYEQWDAFHHAPCETEKVVLTNQALYLYQPEGLTKAVTAPFFCLCDGMRADEWNVLRAQWKKDISKPVRVSGAALVWSDHRNKREVEAFIDSRQPSSHWIWTNLLYHGAALWSAVRVEDIDYADCPLFVPNIHLMDEDEQSAVLNYDKAPVIAWGYDDNWCRNAISTLRQPRERGKDFVLALFSKDPSVQSINIPREQLSEKYDDPNTWVKQLWHDDASDEFYKACAEFINKATCAPECSDSSVKVFSISYDDGTEQYYLVNDKHYYANPIVDTGRNILAAASKLKYFGYEIGIDGTKFRTKIPPRGIDIVEVQFK